MSPVTDEKKEKLADTGFISEKIKQRPGSLTPQIAETQYWVIFLHKFQNLVYRNAVLCYNRTRY